MLVGQLLVAIQQRLGRAVDGGHRRAELVRDRRDEIAVLLLEAAFAGEVAEGVDDAGGAADGDEREPEVCGRRSRAAA